VIYKQNKIKERQLQDLDPNPSDHEASLPEERRHGTDFVAWVWVQVWVWVQKGPKNGGSSLKKESSSGGGAHVASASWYASGSWSC
jgi:hypothetical protein